MLAQPWRIHLFGGLHAQNGNLQITRFKTQKIAGLLAYLAYHLPNVHSREVLIDLFWPESAPEAGRASLSVALSSLRNQLEPPGTPANAVLRADRFSIGLNPQAVTTDVADFEAAIKAAARAGNATERVQQLERAIDLYRGRLLPGMFEEWIAPEETRLAGLYFDAVSALITHLEESRRPAEALRYARQAVGVDPLREEAHGQLMRLLAATGQPGAAMRQYRELERLLDESLQSEPSAALRAQARQIEKESGTFATAPDLPLGRSGVPAPRPLSIENLTGLPVRPGQPATLTFLLTDIEGSTRLWEHNGEVFQGALETHHAALRSAFALYGGQEIQEAGDSFVVAFASARQALACASAGQQALAEAAWPAEMGPLRVRMAVHTGEVEWDEDGDYHGLALHRASRILAAAHGGQVLVSEATTALAQSDLGDDRRLADLGIWRLRDAAAPQRLYQLDYSGMQAAAFPAPTAASGYRSSLPLQYTRFFGREAEIAQLVELLQGQEGERGRGGEGEQKAPVAVQSLPLSTTSDASRGSDNGIPVSPSPSLPLSPSKLVTLTGPGGTGKSRLAVAVAERLLERFQGAVWFVPLADLSDPARIDDAILDALRLTRSPQREPREQVIEFLARQPSLLILDNFEHLITAGVGYRVSGVGEKTEGEKERKNREQGTGDREQAIENRKSKIENLGGAWVVQDYLARVPTLTVLVTSRQLLNLPGEREFPVPPLPTPNGPDSPERLSLYDSVRLFVDRAQAALPYFQVSNANAPAVAELCQRLEGIPLAIELAAARSQVLTPQQMLAQLQDRFEFLTSRKRGVEERHRTLRAAIDWSYRLLTPELQRFFARLSVFRGGWTVEAAEAVCEVPLALDYLAELRECSLVLSEEIDQGMRFRILETLREFADELLSAEERAVLRRRFTDYFSHISYYWHEWLNLRTALDIALEQSDTMAALRLAVKLPWWATGQMTEGRRILADLLAREEAAEPTSARADVLHTIGFLAGYQGDPVSAGAYLEEALAMRRESGNLREIADTLDHLASTAERMGNYDTARSLSQEAIDILRQLGDEAGISLVQCNLARIAFYEGDCVTARTLFHEIATKGPGAYCQLWLAKVARHEGDYERAYELAEDYLLHKAWGRMRKAEVLMTLGDVALHRGNTTEAFVRYAESLSISQELGRADWVSYSLRRLVAFAVAQGQHGRAARLYGADEALRQKQSLHLPPIELPDVEAQVLVLQENLGKEGFTAAWEAGRAMTLEQAVEYALQESET